MTFDSAPYYVVRCTRFYERALIMDRRTGLIVKRYNFAKRPFIEMDAPERDAKQMNEEHRAELFL